MRYSDEYDQVATHRDAMREFAATVGDEDCYRNEQWILTDYDVWVKNPYYRGPDQGYPEDESWLDWSLYDGITW